MKLLLFILMTIGPILNVMADSDHIILRNGQEFDAKLLQITDEKIIYAETSGSGLIQKEISSQDVYMVYIQKYGNMYFTTDGERITGETKRANYRKYDIIYLVKGAEIPAEQVWVSTDQIRYAQKTKSSGFAGFIKKGDLIESTFEKSEVFMIRYRNGMRDIITPIDISKEEEKADNGNTQGGGTEPQFVVVFHAVKKGETLEKIATQYQVTIRQIKEWNDLSAKLKPTAQLAAGTQLMIYQPK